MSTRIPHVFGSPARIPYPTTSPLLLLLQPKPLNPRKPIRPALSMSEPSFQKRPTCPNCSKPTRICLCTRIRTLGLDNKVSVTILQHSLETKHPLNSARLARLGLKNVSLHSVSEVHFGARFAIRLVEPGHGSVGSGNGGERLDLDGVGELGNGLRWCGQDGNFSVEEGSVCVDEGKSSCSRDVIVADIEKYGGIEMMESIWMSPTRGRKRPSFDEFLASEDAVEALAKGFVVKKVQKRRVSLGVELEEFEEFEIVVPPGTALLFPSKNAVGVEELKAMDFEVSNLIVLDGTWAKARRIYEENPWLRLLPHLKLESERLSLYAEVRKEPKAGYLSTIESIVYALKAVGNYPEGLDNLLDVFESMVGDQRRCKDERLKQVSDIDTFHIRQRQ